jgi:hypothetical protein
LHRFVVEGGARKRDNSLLNTQEKNNHEIVFSFASVVPSGSPSDFVPVCGSWNRVERFAGKCAKWRGAPKMAFTTEPSPAHKGGNRVRFKLTDSAGQPVTGAEVTFFKPAMPARIWLRSGPLSKGRTRGGVYEGNGDLASSGIWHVTITARQNGQVIATKKLTVKAMGGM